MDIVKVLNNFSDYKILYEHLLYGIVWAQLWKITISLTYVTDSDLFDWFLDTGTSKVITKPTMSRLNVTTT